jgi:hypothetical protein
VPTLQPQKKASQPRSAAKSATSTKGGPTPPTIPWLSAAQNALLTEQARTLLASVGYAQVTNPGSARYVPIANTLYLTEGQRGTEAALHETLHAYEQFIPGGRSAFSSALSPSDRRALGTAWGSPTRFIGAGLQQALSGDLLGLPGRIGQAAVVAVRGYDPQEAFATIGQAGPGGVRQGLRQFFPYEQSAYARPTLATRQLRAGQRGGPAVVPRSLESLR